MWKNADLHLDISFGLLDGQEINENVGGGIYFNSELYSMSSLEKWTMWSYLHPTFIELLVQVNIPFSRTPLRMALSPCFQVFDGLTMCDCQLLEKNHYVQFQKLIISLKKKSHSGGTSRHTHAYVVSHTQRHTHSTM